MRTKSTINRLLLTDKECEQLKNADLTNIVINAILGGFVATYTHTPIRDKQIALRLPASIDKVVVSIAKETGISKQEVLRQILLT